MMHNTCARIRAAPGRWDAGDWSGPDLDERVPGRLGVGRSAEKSRFSLDTSLNCRVKVEFGTFLLAVGSLGPRSSRFLRLIPDPLRLAMGTDDSGVDVNVIGGTFT